MTQKKARPDLEIPVEAWGTIKGATAKLAWFEQVDAAIAAKIVGGSFALIAINIATNPKGVNSQTGLTWRSARTLADDLGLSEPTVDRLLKEAVAAGLLFVVRKGRPGRAGRSTIFRLAMPEAEIPSPVRRFRRKNPSAHEADIPSSVSEKSPHPCRRNTLTSGSELLRDITPSDLTPSERGAHAHAAQSARAERGNVTETETTSDDAPENPSVSTAIPEPLRPVPRADARTEPITAQQPKPSRDNPIGTAANGADGGSGLSRIRAAFEATRAKRFGHFALPWVSVG
jgi:hypothetical protein